VVAGIDNMAHLGGLVTGLVLGALFAPTHVPTMRSLWMRPGSQTGTMEPVFGAGGMRLIQVSGMILLAVGFLLLWAQGVSIWS
jgi:hypothetical protein